jgi:hypothetical protein
VTRVAHITPIPLLAELLLPSGTRTHLVLTDLVLNSWIYSQFYRNRITEDGHWVILDSNVFETGKEVDPEETLEAVRRLNPSEVVLPDDMESALHTLELSVQTANMLEREGYRGQFMVVPHGRTVEDYLKCMTSLVMEVFRAGRNLTIGLQEEIPQLFGMSRQEMAKRIMLETSGDTRVQLHYLGVSETLTDEISNWSKSRIRSIDTAKFVVWGLTGTRLTQTDVRKDGAPEYPGRKALGGRIEYFTFNTEDSGLRQAAKYNLKRWATI